MAVVPTSFPDVMASVLIEPATMAESGLGKDRAEKEKRDSNNPRVRSWCRQGVFVAHDVCKNQVCEIAALNSHSAGRTSHIYGTQSSEATSRRCGNIGGAFDRMKDEGGE